MTERVRHAGKSIQRSAEDETAEGAVRALHLMKADGTDSTSPARPSIVHSMEFGGALKTLTADHVRRYLKPAIDAAIHRTGSIKAVKLPRRAPKKGRRA